MIRTRFGKHFTARALALFCLLAIGEGSLATAAHGASEEANTQSGHGTDGSAMPDPTTGSKALLCGDFSLYRIRDVKEFIVTRLDERYAERGVVGFLGKLRTDGRLFDPSGKGMKYLLIP